MIQQGTKMYFFLLFSLSVYGKEWQNCFIPRYDDLFVNGRILVNVCAYLCVSLWTCLSICMCWEINVFYCDLDLFPPHKIKEVIRRRFDCLKIEKFFFWKLCSVIIPTLNIVLIIITWIIPIKLSEWYSKNNCL